MSAQGQVKTKADTVVDAILKEARDTLEIQDDGGFELKKPLTLKALSDLVAEVFDIAPQLKKSVPKKGLSLTELSWRPAIAGETDKLAFAFEWSKVATIAPQTKLRVNRIAIQLAGSQIKLFADAELELFGFTADVQAMYPADMIIGTLRSGSIADHPAFFKRHGLVPEGRSALEPAGEPKLDGLSVYYAVRTQRLVIALRASNLFKLRPFRLRTVEAELEYAGGPNGTLSAELYARVALAGPSKTSIDLDLTARVANNSWAFEAAMVPGSAFKVGELADHLLSKIGKAKKGAFHIPGLLQDLTVTGLDLSLDGDGNDEVFLAFALPELGHLNCQLRISKTASDVSAWVAITLDDLDFRIALDEPLEGDVGLLATFKDKSDVELIALINQLTGGPQITPPLDLGLRSAALGYLAAGAKKGAKSRKVASLALDASLNLTAFPQLGALSSTAGKLGDILVCYALDPMTGSDVTALDKMLSAAQLPALPVNTAPGATDNVPVVEPGLSLRSQLNLGFGELPIEVGGTGGSTASDGGATGAVSQANASIDANNGSGNASWYPIQKALGPFYVDKVGATLAKSKLWFLLNASVSLGPLSLGLLEAKIGSPLRKFEPEFGLHGLSVDFQSGPLQIGGGFLSFDAKYDGKSYQGFAGEVLVRAEILTASAIGSYAHLPNGETSLFLYAALDYPIGGPPFFFITGLAGGLGYNRRVVVPKAEDVPSFPFVQAITGGRKKSASKAIGGAQIANSLNAELSKLGDTLPLDRGEYFFAVGVRFTTFEMLDSIVVLSMEFGKRFEIDVLGLTTFVVPTPPPGESADQEPEPPILELQLATKASFAPADGDLKIRSVLTANSFLFSRDCRITGGLALYAWFDGCKEGQPGDVVATIGGYHSKFRVPDYFPRVPRLGFDWRVNSEIGIKGDAYFALTPHAVMAGGHLAAVWHSGPLRAWFKAGADFLLSWQPYSYDAEIYVSIGAELTFHFFGTHHVTVEVGGDLHVWGPKFAGKVTIHYWVFSVTVHFGPDKREIAPIDWPTFRNAFLGPPKPTLPGDGLIRLAVKAGLLTEVKTEDGLHWVCNAKDLRIEFSSKVPLTHVCIDSADHQVERSQLGIGSMGLTSDRFTSRLTIRIADEDGNDVSSRWFRFNSQKSELPAALWRPADKAGHALLPDLNAKRTISAVDGVVICPKTSNQDINPTEDIPADVLLNATVPISQKCSAAKSKKIPKIKPVTQKEIVSFLEDNPTSGQTLLAQLEGVT